MGYKVAICSICGGMVAMHHTDYPESIETKKSFDQLEKDGFIIETESAKETMSRNWNFGEKHDRCKKKECEPNPVKEEKHLPFSGLDQLLKGGEKLN